MKIMLCSDMPPCNNYTAGIVLDKLCGFLLDAGHDVCCFTIEMKGVTPIISSDKLERMVFGRAIMPRENYGRIANGLIGKLASFVFNNAAALFRIPQLAKRAILFAKANKPDIIWNVVQGQTTIRIVRRLARGAKLPYVIQIWDPPTWWLRENNFDGITTRSVLKEYGAAIHGSKCCITASKAMNEEYIKRYNPTRAVPVILGFDPVSLTPDTGESSDFVIAFSGQSYAANELISLISALSTLGWECEGKRIVLRLYGRHFGFLGYTGLVSATNIELRGWLSQDKLLSELASADLLYCPYWFDTTFREETTLSFPSKLSTYLTTGIPVIVHAPEYASPRRFIEENSAGYVCGSLDCEELANVLKQIIRDKDRKLVGQRGYSAFCNNLTVDIMRSSFFSALFGDCTDSM